MKKHLFALAALATLAPANLSAHCQVPCGIFDNDNVLSKMHTDFETIEKAALKINELSKDVPANIHQITRWINVKESHAQDIQDTISQYFLAQRLKLAEAEKNKETYLAKLTLCHKVIVAAMKTKQSTDPKAVNTLHDLLHDMQKHFGTKTSGENKKTSLIGPKPKNPIAKASNQPGIVLSPFKEGTLISVSGMSPGDIAKDPVTGKLFIVPQAK